ncbi:PDIA3 isoform 2 [Pan troglodytes]|uniref:PDIA3 isoform 2 n=3 Tax=Hominidae TaxID=9604 RepID=A0A6D2WR19_PANTR|nr:PDIA3 isoform 2 [Pan troglodytes]
MRLRRLALFPGVALLLAAARLAAASDVLELTDDNFESRISDTGSAGLMLVEFFAPCSIPGGFEEESLLQPH